MVILLKRQACTIHLLNIRLIEALAFNNCEIRRSSPITHSLTVAHNIFFKEFVNVIIFCLHEHSCSI